MKILIIKLSSFGDLIHTFPAITELKTHYPEANLTWLVDAGLAEVVRWHPMVTNIIAAPLRQLKKQRGSWAKLKMIGMVVKAIRSQRYDVIIDAQGLFKSALLAYVAKGPRVGFAKQNCRESVWWLYHRRVLLTREMHVILRLKTLCAKALRYPLNPAITYGLETWQPNASKAIFIAHGTTWPNKHYPDSFWLELIQLLTEQGYTILLPHGQPHEYERVQRFVINAQVQILAKMSLTQVKNLLLTVTGLVGVDTGFSHLATALGVPSVIVYGPTNPKEVGIMNQRQHHLGAEFPCAPCGKRQCFHPERDVAPSPPCFRALPPRLVYEHLLAVL